MNIECDFFKRMEESGYLGPQTLTAECTFLKTCISHEGGPVCRVDVCNGSDSVQTAFAELLIDGKKISENISVL